MLNKQHSLYYRLCLLFAMLFLGLQLYALDSYPLAVYHELPTASLVSLTPTRYFLSAWVASASGSAKILFIETDENQNVIESKTRALTLNFDNGSLKDRIPTLKPGELYDSAHFVRVKTKDAGYLTWYRGFFAFDYNFDLLNNPDNRVFIVLQNVSTEDGCAVWFDGIQLEKALFDNQQRPTTYASGAKLVSPSKELALDAKHRYFEW